MTFTDAHLDEWRRNGYVIVEGFLSTEQVDRALASLHRVVPTWEQYRDERERWPKARPLTWLSFPYDGDEQNDITVREDLLDFVERALDTSEILLAHSQILCKYAGEADFDQAMHRDYLNNTLVVPAADDFDQVTSITYYNDVTVDLGPTRVVSFADSAGFEEQVFWAREHAPALYEAERAVTVPAGSILLYGMHTFHRGSAFTATEGARFSHHIAFQRRSMTWAGWRDFPRAGLDAALPRLLSRATTRQRSALGFPPPGDPYWTPWTIDAVSRRYPDMDMADYR